MPDNLCYIHSGCWWYERHMPDNLHYIHGGWLVVQASHACPTIYATYTRWLLVVRVSHARQFTLHTRCLVSRTPDNLLYKHGSHCQLDEQLGSLVDGQQRRQTEGEKGKGQIKKTNGNCIIACTELG